MFADDTKIYSQILSVKDCEDLQIDLEALQKWSEKWLLNFNSSKCKALRLGKNSPDFNYRMGQNLLEETEMEKDLGILIDKNLRLTKHTEAQVGKANKLVGLIRRSYEHLDADSLVQLYKALVRPHLEYGHIIWPLTYKTDLRKVENVQRSVTKMIPRLRGRPMSYEQRLETLKLPSIAYRRCRGDMIEVYKLLYGKYTTNSDLLRIKVSTTRGHNLKLEKQRFRLSIRKHSFPVRVVTPWNSLPKSVVTSPTMNTFKNRIDKHWQMYQYSLEPPLIRTHYEKDTAELIEIDQEEPDSPNQSTGH